MPNFIFALFKSMSALGRLRAIQSTFEHIGMESRLLTHLAKIGTNFGSLDVW